MRYGKINKKYGKERVFKLIKFLTMTSEKDLNRKLLPKEARFKKYGKFLRNTLFDELIVLINILKGDMSIIEVGCVIEVTKKSINFSMGVVV